MKRSALVWAVALSLVTFFPRSATAEEMPTPVSKPFESYMNVGLGGDFRVGGSAYDNRDPRVVFQVEAGSRYFAFPVSISRAQHVFTAGVKPRGQFLWNPFSGLPNLYFGPGLGGVFNYWHASDDEPNAFSARGDVLELGVQASFQIQYHFKGRFHVQLTPAALDFNLWRQAWVEIGPFEQSGKDGRFGLIYSFFVSGGLSF